MQMQSLLIVSSHVAFYPLNLVVNSSSQTPSGGPLESEGLYMTRMGGKAYCSYLLCSYGWLGHAPPASQFPNLSRCGSNSAVLVSIVLNRNGIQHSSLLASHFQEKFFGDYRKSFSGRLHFLALFSLQKWVMIGDFGRGHLIILSWWFPSSRFYLLMLSRQPHPKMFVSLRLCSESLLLVGLLFLVAF